MSVSLYQHLLNCIRLDLIDYQITFDIYGTPCKLILLFLPLDRIFQSFINTVIIKYLQYPSRIHEKLVRYCQTKSLRFKLSFIKNFEIEDCQKYKFKP